MCSASVLTETNLNTSRKTEQNTNKKMREQGIKKKQTEKEKSNNTRKDTLKLFIVCILAFAGALLQYFTRTFSISMSALNILLAELKTSQIFSSI